MSLIPGARPPIRIHRARNDLIPDGNRRQSRIKDNTSPGRSVASPKIDGRSPGGAKMIDYIYMKEIDRARHIPRRPSRFDLSIWSLVLKRILILSLGVFLSAEFGGTAFAQRTTSTSSARGFILTGDVRVQESQASEPGPTVLD